MSKNENRDREKARDLARQQARASKFGFSNKPKIYQPERDDGYVSRGSYRKTGS